MHWSSKEKKRTRKNRVWCVLSSIARRREKGLAMTMMQRYRTFQQPWTRGQPTSTGVSILKERTMGINKHCPPATTTMPLINQHIYIENLLHFLPVCQPECFPVSDRGTSLIYTACISWTSTVLIPHNLDAASLVELRDYSTQVKKNR